MKKETKMKDSQAEFKANLERETRVLLEEVRQQFETVAEGHSFLVKKAEEHDQRFDLLDRKLEDHDQRFNLIGRKLEEHDRRFDRLEAATLENGREIKTLKEGQKRIEGKLDYHEQRLQRIETVVKV